MKTGKTRRVPLWLRIVIPAVLIVAWLAAAGIGGPYFGKIEEVADSDLSAFLPKSSDAAKVNEQAGKFRSDDTVPAIVLFEATDDAVLSEEQITQLNEVIVQVEAVEGVSSESAQLVKSEDGKAAFAALPIETNGEVDKTVAAINDTITENEVNGVKHWVTGPAGFLSDLSVAFAGIDGILLLVALGVVFLILLFVYRSPCPSAATPSPWPHPNTAHPRASQTAGHFHLLV